VTPAELQCQMGAVFEQLKTLEVQIQATSAELGKSMATELTTGEGLEEARKRVRECKAIGLVEIAKYVAARKDVETLERFFDQAKTHRQVLQANLNKLSSLQKQGQLVYEQLGAQFAKADNNVLTFPGV
jgi:ribosomal 50S subunit-associated protein YjgA (DUF615 family)